MNPYSDQFEYIVATHQILSAEDPSWQEAAVYPQPIVNFPPPQPEWQQAEVPRQEPLPAAWSQWEQQYHA